MKRSVLAALAAMSFAGASYAQCDQGDWLLTVNPNPAGPGDTVTVCLSGPPNEMAGLFTSFDPTPTDLGKYGTICLSFPLFSAQILDLDASGQFCFSVTVPCDPVLTSLTIYSSFITCSPSPGHSNTVTIVFEDEPCLGEFCSYGQFTWGQACGATSPIACLRDQNFASVFPNGLGIGDKDGADADSCFSLLLSSAAAVEAFLPNHGPAQTLTADVTDPASSAAGDLAGLLVIAKLNVGFDDAGLFDASRGATDHRLGDLVYVNCVNAKFLGKSIRDAIALADDAICGTYGAIDAAHNNVAIIDVDGDTIPDLSLNDVQDLLRYASCNFIECEQDLGCFGFAP